MAEIVVESIGERLTHIQRIDSKGWSVATTVLHLPDGKLAVVSPTRGLEDEVAKLGIPAFLIAPNFFHHMGLGAYAERWPEVRLLCSKQARGRVMKKSGRDLEHVEDFKDLLPQGMEVFVPPGLRTGEILIRAKGDFGLAWLVTDAFFHVEKNPTGGIGMVCRMSRTTPGLQIGRTFTGLAVKKKTEYGQWLRSQLEEDQPTVLLPAHGRPLCDKSLSDRLDEQIRLRLSS